MTSITSSLAYALNQKNLAAAQNTQTISANNAASSGSGSSFGNAVNVTLSPSAQAVVNAQGASSPSATNDNTATVSGTAAGASGGKKSGGPLVLPSSSSSTTDTATLVEEALQQVIPQVGVTEASEVVDSQGNIDQVKLDTYLAQQDTKSAAAV